MAIWKKDLSGSVGPLNATLGGAAGSLGIEIVEIGPDFLRGKMPVDARTVQPFGILHGGASCVLAETLGSVAANLCLEEPGMVGVGMSLQANHFRPATKGFVWGMAKARHLGKKSQVWAIDITNDEGKAVCLAVLTMAITEASRRGV